MSGACGSVRVIDSHTGGEPTRVIVEGSPDLGGGSLQERARRFEQQFNHFRRMIIDEPRGNEAMVGALLCASSDDPAATDVIFFNNRGCLGMCGHGAIGVAVTLAHLQRVSAPSMVKLRTPVGAVTVELFDSHRAAIENVPSYRFKSGVTLGVDRLGEVTGDIAWGGNWFFLVEGSPVPICQENISQLTDAALGVREQLNQCGIRGADESEIDHIEFFGPGSDASADSRNFVLCPGGAYDRSPCGTGTSAKLACLAADNKLQPGEPWVQESIIGSRFTASYRLGESGQIIPTIEGEAFIYGETSLLQQEGDPFAIGISSWPRGRA